MRVILFLLLGWTLHSRVAHAQAVQVWNRTYTGIEPMYYSYTTSQFGPPLALPNGQFLVNLSVQNGFFNSSTSSIWLFNSQGDTVRAPWKRGNYGFIAPSVRGDLMVSGIGDGTRADSLFYGRMSYAVLHDGDAIAIV